MLSQCHQQECAASSGSAASGATVIDREGWPVYGFGDSFDLDVNLVEVKVTAEAAETQQHQQSRDNGHHARSWSDLSAHDDDNDGSNTKKYLLLQHLPADADSMADTDNGAGGATATANRSMHAPSPDLQLLWSSVDHSG